MPQALAHRRQDRLLSPALLLVACLGLLACGSTSDPDEPSDAVDAGRSLSLGVPQEFVANTLSAASVALSWLAVEESASYRIYRDSEAIAVTAERFFIDSQLSMGRSYRYYVVGIDNEDLESAASETATATTLVNATNDGLRNGSAGAVNNAERLVDSCGVATASQLPDEQLDSCLRTIIDGQNLPRELEDMRAFAARLRSGHTPAMLDLGMKLFHSKSLSQNTDTACSSCHHPALGCGGDGLSLPIGVNALSPALLGPGRSDGTALPSVPRHSNPTCNSALWTRGLFWDNRVSTNGGGRITTEEDAVTDALRAVAAPSMLMAQAHFPVTAAPEMGDASGFAEPQDYRDDIAANLSEAWNAGFESAFGSADITFTKIAEAIAYYEESQLFIDNAFFDYIDGDVESISYDEKRGAIVFLSQNSGCRFCHTGVFFSTEALLPPAYPQIGIGGDDAGFDRLNYRAPSLLNVGISAPYGHAGQFQTLERVIRHYNDPQASLTDYFANDEVCDLNQFSNLGADCATVLAPNGLANSQAVYDASQTVGFPGPNFDEEEISWVAAFLQTLTDEKALPGSAAIEALIPERNGGPDGNQLDAVDRSGRAL